MLSPIEVIIIIVIITGVTWWWRMHGIHDYALKYTTQHCDKLDIKLLDGYVALKKITFKRDINKKIRLANIYSFEFTITGEQRYTGTVTLFGYYIDSIDLPPYPFMPKEKDNIFENNISTPKKILTLDDYRNRKKENE